MARPCRFRTANLKNKVAQDLRTIPCVVNLGMELHRKPFFRHVLNSRDRV